MECFSLPSSTNRLTGLPLTSWVSVLSPWQERQSASFSFCAACAVDAQKTNKTASVRIKKMTRAFTATRRCFVCRTCSDSGHKMTLRETQTQSIHHIPGVQSHKCVIPHPCRTGQPAATQRHLVTKAASCRGQHRC